MKRRRRFAGRAACALAIATASATAVVASAPPAPSAPSTPVRTLASSCKPGHAVGTSGVMKVDGLPKSDALLKQSDIVFTGDDSQAQVCLQQGSIRCTVWANSTIVVLPKGAPDVIMRTAPNRDADVGCTATNNGKRKNLDFGNEKITLGALGLKPQQRPRSPQAVGKTSSSAHLFALRVHRGKATLKVRRGVTVVAPKTKLREGVVVGRNQQVTVRRGGAPSEPVRSHETSKERQTLDQYERLLPPADTTAPTPVVAGPTEDSSLRSPTFRFGTRPTEAGVVFSCSLEKPNDFRVCVDGQPFGALEVGSHTVWVKATDAAGNTTKTPIEYDWSIAENRIVFARGPAGGPTDIWVMDSDGSNQVQLTHDGDSGAHARTPEWSPDHKRIAFDSDVAGKFNIYVMDADGGKRHELTDDSQDDRNPTWSPDGKEIAFERGPSGKRDIYVMGADGGILYRLTSNSADDLDPAWSPDGSQIAFASTRNDNYDIWVIDAQGGIPTDLTDTPDATEFGPAWSPDGEQIAFHRKIDRPTPVPNDIYVMDRAGKKAEKITQTGWDDYYPSWAPDGREIVFYSARVPESKQAYIFFVSLDVRIEAQLTTEPLYSYLPDW